MPRDLSPPDIPLALPADPFVLSPPTSSSMEVLKLDLNFKF